MAKKKQLAAIIHLGSERVTMQLIEYTDLYAVTILDEASQTVRLGEETFKTGRISTETMRALIDILKGFRRLMKDYGIKDYVLEATTAVREARNRTFFLDQVLVKTGFVMDVINLPQEIFRKIASLSYHLESHKKKVEHKGGHLLVDLSSGAMGFTYVRRGEMEYQQNLHVGLIRMKEYFTRNEQSSIHFGEALREYIRANLFPVMQELENKPVESMFISGVESSYLPRILKKKPDKKGLIKVGAGDLEEILLRLRSLSPRQLTKVYALSEEEADLVLPAATLYEELIRALYIARQKDPAFMAYMQSIQMSQIRGVARRFGTNLVHVGLVADLCEAIFKTVAKSEGLDGADLHLLRAAALLHGVGKFFSLRAGKLYNYELIQATDFLGFGPDAQQTIASVSYLFSLPSPDALSPEAYDREISATPAVAKLAAILRLADALDVSRKQKITGCRTVMKENQFRVIVTSREDLSLERWTFEKQSGFFEEVFGLTPILEQVER